MNSISILYEMDSNINLEGASFIHLRRDDWLHILHFRDDETIFLIEVSRILSRLTILYHICIKLNLDIM